MTFIEFEPDQELQVVDTSANFESYLTDIEIDKLSVEELEARIVAARAGALVRMPDGEFLQVRGGYVRESRVIDSTQAAVARSVARVYEQSRIDKRAADGYDSFLEDVVRRTIKSPDELQGRLIASRTGNAVKVNDEYFLQIGGGYVREARKVSREQGAILVEAAKLVQKGAATQTAADAFTSYLADLNLGKIPSVAQLQARLVAAQTGNLVRKPDDEFLLERGGYVREVRKLDGARRAMLERYAAELIRVRETSRTFNAKQSYLNDILNGIIKSRDELQGRFAAARTGNAVKVNDEYLQIGGGYVRESRVITSEQCRELDDLFKSYLQLDERSRNYVRTMFNSGNYASANERMDEDRRNSLTSADLTSNERKAQIVARISKFAARSAIEVAVADRLKANPGDTQATFELLRDYPVESEDDRVFTASLTSLAYDSRRFDFSLAFYRKLHSIATTEGFTELLGALTELSESPFAQDAERARELAVAAYQKELTTAEQTLLQAISAGASEEKIADIKGSLPIRASVGQFAYAEELAASLQKIELLEAERRRTTLQREIYTLLRLFRAAPATTVLATIQELPAELDADTRIRERVLQFYKQYLLSRRDRRPDDYREAFSFEVQALKQIIAPEYDFDQDLGRNAAAVTLLAGRYTDVIHPLFQSLKADAAGERLMDYIRAGGRDRSVQNLERLRRQRQLSTIEEAYLASVQMLSYFNPNLLALANTNPGIVSVYLESYFKRQSEATFETIADGEYVPLLQIGLGPNGLTAAGELLRSRPDLAAGALFVDNAELPGGPFAVPKGPAWDLNSANSANVLEPMLPAPSKNPADEMKTVRAYGSPLRWFPGERLNDSDVRQGSINATVDYLITPDGISDTRYPDNADMALILQLQAALVARRAVLRTEVVSVESAGDARNPQRKFVTLRQTTADGERTVRVQTDNLIISSGLGAPTYGFELRGSRAQAVLQASQDGKRFPRLADTLTAFRALASLENENGNDQPEPGEVMVIYGNGNSADTLIEYLGGLFQGGNRSVRNIKKIYVITNGSLSRRPRYAAISDLRSRRGEGSLVEIVKARVGDVSFAGNSNDPDQPLVLFDTNGNMIRDSRGELIKATNVIAATGFQSKLDRVLAPLLRGKRIRSEGALKSLALPTNKNVTVADTLANDPSVLFVGTASRPGFEIADKLSQLPREAREALLRNGAENAVAIGFRAPDTQAAVRLFTQSIPTVPTQDNRSTNRRLPHANDETAEPAIFMADSPLPRTRRDTSANAAILTPLINQALADVRIDHYGEVRYSYQLQFDANRTLLRPLGPSSAAMNAAVDEACRNPYFLAYARKAIRARRNSSAIQIELNFQRGRLNYQSSFAQPA